VIEVETKLSGSLLEGLDKYEKRIQDEVTLSGAAAMARVIYDEVKLNASGARGTGTPGGPPRRGDGTLGGAIYRVYAKDLSTPTMKVYRVSVNKSTARHWALIEYGTSRAPAYPYLRPAFSRIGDAIASGQRRMAEVLAGKV